MSESPTVDFPGKQRIHIALDVKDIERSVEFYSMLLVCSPSKRRPRYAKFEPKDPSINLALNESSGEQAASRGVSAHFGIQVKSVAEVHQAIERFKASGYETITEEATTCCYAVQDKVWVVDPDGHRWEVFVVLQADVKDELYAQSGCCSPEGSDSPDVVGLSATCGVPQNRPAADPPAS
ncbi:MAG TPA: glyoxalase/bleomycin resistance/dioxygenase family protein [Planctomycetaceae bacterium]|nr:glyoxalase/bleomycin resistance/dioxygenase family protein [Planctomycetaceae bacterium]